MGLKSDIQEVLEVWDRAPWRVRIFLGLSLFLASTSIASLSEAIFKWKGFVLDGVTLYRSLISSPIRDMAERLLHYEPRQAVVDIALVAILLAVASLRVALFHSKESYLRISEIGAIVTMIGAIIALVASDGFGGAAWLAGGMIGASFLINAYFHVRNGGAPGLLWFTYILAPFLLVGLVGAIHTGITR